VGVFSIVQYPNFWLDVNPDYAWIMRLTLIHTRRVDVEAIWMVREDAREGINYDPRRLEEFLGEHWRARLEVDCGSYKDRGRLRSGVDPVHLVG